MSTLLQMLTLKWILLIGISLIILASGIFGYEIRQSIYLVLFAAILFFTVTLPIIWRGHFFPNGLTGGLTNDRNPEINESGLHQLFQYKEHRLFKNKSSLNLLISWRNELLTPNLSHYHWRYYCSFQSDFYYRGDPGWNSPGIFSIGSRFSFELGFVAAKQNSASCGRTDF